MIRKNYLGIDNSFLPFLRRFLIVLRPLEVDIRVRKPESFKITFNGKDETAGLQSFVPA